MSREAPAAEGLNEDFLATPVSIFSLLFWIQELLSTVASETQVTGLVNLARSPIICSEKLSHMVGRT